MSLTNLNYSIYLLTTFAQCVAILILHRFLRSISQNGTFEQRFQRRSLCVVVVGQRKYSKRRRSNVAVIIVRVIFISSFFFYCLLLNHSFQTNPNSITNFFKLFSLLQLTTTLLLRRFLILN